MADRPNATLVVSGVFGVTFADGYSLQSRRIYGERTLTFFAKCLAAILDFLGRGRLGRETNFYQEGWLGVKVY